MEYSISTKQAKMVIDLNSPTYGVSLSRTGSQGSQGVSVVSADIVNNELVLTMSDGNTINAGDISGAVTGNAPTDLNSLEKLAQAINNDPNFFQTLRPIAYSGSLSDVESGNLTVGSVTGGSY